MVAGPDDIVGVSQLTRDAVVEISKLVEAAQTNATLVSSGFLPGAQGPTTHITGLIHNAIRGISNAVDGAVKGACTERLKNDVEGMGSSPARETIVAAMNGVVGDHLAATGNPLAIRMSVRRNGCRLSLEKSALTACISEAGGKLLVLVHGLCRNDLQWGRNGAEDYGVALGRDLGYTPVYLHYNSGLHISENGQTFADLLETLVKQWPVQVKELVIIAHSAGGLVSRSAYHHGAVAGQQWTRHLQHLFFVGTPHHGAPLERWGNLLNVNLDLGVFSAPYSRIAKIRSAGITDLRYGNVRHEDWQGRDRFAHWPDMRTPLPLPVGVRCYAIAATSAKRGNARSGVVGDGIVPLDSALGRHPDPAMALQFARSHQWIGYEMNHWDLLCHPAVYERIRGWLQS